MSSVGCLGPVLMRLAFEAAKGGAHTQTQSELDYLIDLRFCTALTPATISLPIDVLLLYHVIGGLFSSVVRFKTPVGRLCRLERSDKAQAALSLFSLFCGHLHPMNTVLAAKRVINIAARGKAKAVDVLRACNELRGVLLSEVGMTDAAPCLQAALDGLESLLEQTVRHHLAHASVCGAVLALWGGLYHVRPELEPTPTAVSTVVAVRQRHITYPGVGPAGFATLVKIACGESARARRQLIELGAARIFVDALCDIMKSSEKLSTLQASTSIAAMVPLCSTADGALAFVEAGVMRVVSQVVAGPEVAAALLTQAGAVVSMLTTHESAAGLLVQQGLYSRVIRVVLRDYGQHCDAIEHWCSAMSNLCNGAVLLPQLVEPSVVAGLLRLLQTHIDCGAAAAVQVLGLICNAVARLATAAARPGVEATEVLADRQRPASIAADGVGCSTLLSAGSACGGAGAQLPLSGTAENHHEGVEDAVSPAARERLSAALLKGGAFEKMCAVLARYPADGLVARACCAGMASLLELAELPLADSVAAQWAQLAWPALLGVALRPAGTADAASDESDLLSASRTSGVKLTTAVCKVLAQLVDALPLELCPRLGYLEFFSSLANSLLGCGRHLDSPIVLGACKAAVAIGKRSTFPGADELADYGACKLLHCAVRALPLDASLAQFSLTAIHDLLQLNPSLAKQMVLRLDAVQLCVGAVQRHAANGVVVTAAVRTLAFLLARAPPAPEHDPLTLAVEAGGIAAISSALTLHVHDAELSALLCRVLVFDRLLSHSYDALGLDGDGKLAAIVASAWQVLQLHPDHELGNAFACELVGFEPAQQHCGQQLPAPLLPEGAAEILLRQLRLYAHDAVHVGFVCTVVRRACSVPAFMRRLVEAGVVDSMSAALAAHASDYYAVLYGAAAFARVYAAGYSGCGGDRAAESGSSSWISGSSESSASRDLVGSDGGTAVHRRHDDADTVMCNSKLQALLPAVCGFLVAALRAHTPGDRSHNLAAAAAETAPGTAPSEARHINADAAAPAERGAEASVATPAAAAAAAGSFDSAPLAVCPESIRASGSQAAAQSAAAPTEHTAGVCGADASPRTTSAAAGENSCTNEVLSGTTTPPVPAAVESAAGSAAAIAADAAVADAADASAAPTAAVAATSSAAAVNPYGADVLRDLPAELPVTAAQACLLAMCSIAAEPLGRAQLHRAGAPAAIVDAVRAYEASASAEFREIACRALRNLAAAPVDAVARHAMLADGCVEVCLDVADPLAGTIAGGEGPDDASEESDAGSADEAAEPAEAANVVAREADVLWAAYGTLFGLACEPGNCAALLQQQVAHAAVAAMKRHETDWRVCWACCGVLLRLGQYAATTDSASEERLLWQAAIDGEAVSLVRAVMGHHAEERRVVRAATALLALHLRLEEASFPTAASVSVAEGSSEPEVPQAVADEP